MYTNAWDCEECAWTVNELFEYSVAIGIKIKLVWDTATCEMVDQSTENTVIKQLFFTKDDSLHVLNIVYFKQSHVIKHCIKHINYGQYVMGAKPRSRYMISYWKHD